MQDCAIFSVYSDQLQNTIVYGPFSVKSATWLAQYQNLEVKPRVRGHPCGKHDCLLTRVYECWIQ